MADNSICSVDDCGKSAKKVGLCFAHYERKRRHGSPLGGGPRQASNGVPAAYLRDVVMKYEGNDCLIWPYSRSGITKSGGGRAQIKQGKVNRNVHRIVCEEVKGPPPTPEHEAAHSCGKGHLGCVNPNHLEWKTRAENQADRLVHGTHNRGERSGRAKLTEENVRSIRAAEGKLPRTEIARHYGVSLRCIHSIIKGQNWRSVL